MKQGPSLSVSSSSGKDKVSEGGTGNTDAAAEHDDRGNNGNDDDDDGGGGGGIISRNTRSDRVIVLEDFAHPQHNWVPKNDMVLGGQSEGTFTIDEQNGWGHLSGRVHMMPFLETPGFIKVETSPPSRDFPDLSSCEGLQYTIFQKESSALSYTGYRVSFGLKTPATNSFPHIYGYKAKLDVPLDQTVEHAMVQIPFYKFTNNWSPTMGRPIATCHQDPQYCPDLATLERNLYSLAIWGESVEGVVDLKVKSISAYNCFSSTEASASQGGVSIQQVSPTNNAAVKTVTTTTTSASATTSTQGSQQVVVSGDEIVLEDFAHPVNAWATLNDPVMGGQSTSSLTIANGMAHFEGYCSIVPSLQAPGFITMATGGYRQRPALFPDVSTCTGLKLILRSPTAATYQGYYVSFGTIRLPEERHARGYKTPIHQVPSKGKEEDGFGEVLLPFSSFSAKRDEVTGKTLVPCSPENLQYCPDVDTLQDMKAMSIWGRGVEGAVDLEIQSIRAYGCDTTDSASAMMAEVTVSTSHGKSSSSSRSIPLSWGAPVAGTVLLFVLLFFLSIAQVYYVARRGRMSIPKEDEEGVAMSRSKYIQVRGSSHIKDDDESSRPMV